jgi:hypothetical protein
MSGRPVAEDTKVVDIRSWRKARTRDSDREEVAAFAAHCSADEREFSRVMNSDAAYEEWWAIMVDRYRLVAEILEFWDFCGFHQDL